MAPGILSLVLRRAYSSGYATGRLFGPGWSSTVDQRLSVNDAGIHFVGDDGETLHYPVPAPGQASMPTLGTRSPLVWDRETDEIRITNPASGQALHFATVHHRDDMGQIRDLTAISDRNGNRIDIERDPQGTPTTLTHSGGHRITVQTAATASGLRVTSLKLIESPGEPIAVRSFAYDERGRLTAVTDARGSVQRYGHDDRDRITSVTNSLGHTRQYHYDENRKLTALVDDEGGTLRFEQDRFGRLLAGADRFLNERNLTIQYCKLG